MYKGNKNIIRPLFFINVDEGILIEESLIRSEKERKELEKKGYKIVRKKEDENLIHVFDEDKTALYCNKDESIFWVSLLASTLCRIIITERLTTVILFSKRVQTYSFRIPRNVAIKGIREIYRNVSTFQEFIIKYLNFLNENNDDKLIEWLRETIKEKKGNL